MARRWSKPTLQALAMAAVVLAIGACGADDPESAPGSEVPTTTAAPAPASPLRARLEERVVELLTERGLDDAVVQCALTYLRDSVSDDEIDAAVQQIRETSAAPPDLIEAALSAGGTCASP
jgi:hypothetical protein